MRLLFAIALWFGSTAAAGQPSDSIDILRAVRASQGRFERFRLGFLPWHDGGSSDPCDEHIGQFCFRYGDRHTIQEPPPDSQPVVQRRDQLIDELARAARVLPGDAWITGQLVRYLVEGKHTGEAVRAAGDCRAATDWCLSLLGFARHEAGEFAAADSAYAEALGRMPRDQRCRWTDLSPLPGTVTREYRRLPCEARDSLERRFWWLADPLYLIPGNERRSEHFSRWVMNRLQDDAASPWGYGWRDDHRQILIRFGWPSGWRRSRPTASSTPGEWAVAAEFREPSRAFEPPARFVERPESLTAGAWSLIPARPPGGYVPSYAALVDPLKAQIGVFRHAGGVVLLAKYDLTQDSVAPDTPTSVALSLAPGPPPLPRHETVNRNARARGAISLEAPAVSGLVSLEALAERRAGRERRWLTLGPLPVGRHALSDLLLLSRADPPPRTFGEALPLMLESSSMEPGILGLYWEAYGMDPGRPYSVAVTAVRESAGFFRRAARAIGLVGDARPQVRLGWTKVSEAGHGSPGALELDLSTAKPGRYTIRLVVTARGDSAVTERLITIR